MMGILSKRRLVGAAVGLGLAALAAGPALASPADAEVEQFVQTRGTQALQTLAQAGDHETRQRAFIQQMSELADVPRVSLFVLGRYGAQVRGNPALFNQWVDTFRAYTMAAYEDNLTRFRGRSLTVTGSIDRVPGQDVIVLTELNGGSGEPTRIKWRMLHEPSGWKVLDVALVLQGNEVWLAQQQQAQFLAALDRNNGDINALIASVRQTTATLQARVRAAR